MNNGRQSYQQNDYMRDHAYVRQQQEDEPALEDLVFADQINLYYIRNTNPDLDGDLSIMGTLSRLELCGKKTNRGQFCYPQDLE